MGPQGQKKVVKFSSEKWQEKSPHEERENATMLSICHVLKLNMFNFNLIPETYVKILG